MYNKEQLDYLESLGIETKIPEDTGEKKFIPISGTYQVMGVDLVRNQGISKTNNNPYDNYRLSMQVVKTLKGDPGERRFLNKTYWNGLSDYNETDELKGAKQLVSALLIMGINMTFDRNDGPNEIISKNMDKIVGHTFYVRTYLKDGKQVVIVIAKPSTEVSDDMDFIS